MKKQKHIFFTIACFLAILNFKSQQIMVNPYLQNVTHESASLFWQTSNCGSWKIEWGYTINLGNQRNAHIENLHSSSACIQHVHLDSLLPNTKYYYQVTNNLETSGKYSFVTASIPSAETKTTIVAMSDMQQDNANPNKFYDVVNNGVLNYFQSNFNGTFNEHLNMVLIPGDLVDDGEHHEDWVNHFFNQGSNLFSYVPLYPVLGNHERDSPLYFQYFELPSNGSVGYKEHWWYKDRSNVRIIGMDSNGGYRIQEQLVWLDSVLLATEEDTLIDFVFLQLHHPHRSELWPIGNTDFTGDVIEKMEAFSTSSGKPSIHFYGHTHGYSRGQSRDHHHLMVNVASGGGNIDYWDEYFQQDYPEHIISQDEYGFVLLEVEAGQDPHFVLKRISLGNEIEEKQNTLEDSIKVKRYSNVPTTPNVFSPLFGDTVDPEGFFVDISDFENQNNSEHGATHIQISEDEFDFTNSTVDYWHQYKNLYKGVDKQENTDLHRIEIKTLIPAKTYYCRVRFRDQSLNWSNWSSIVSFHTTNQYNNWKLFPNPTHGEFRINIPLNSNEIFNVQIYDQKGQKVKEFLNVQPPVLEENLKGFRMGNYLVKIVSLNGEVKNTFKLTII